MNLICEFITVLLGSHSPHSGREEARGPVTREGVPLISVFYGKCKQTARAGAVDGGRGEEREGKGRK